MHIQFLPQQQYIKTLVLGVIASLTVVTVAAFLGRATLNLRAALTEKPDVGVFVLLKDQGITDATLLREEEHTRDYLVETESGPKLVELTRGDKEWYVSYEEELKAD